MKITHKLNGKPTASVRSNNDLSLIDYSNINLRGKDTILFVWYDEVEGEHETSSGIILQHTLSKDRPRWGIVVKSNCEDVKEGEFIMPENTSEPFGTVIENVEHWRTTPDKIILVTTDKHVVNTLEDA